MTDAFVLWFGSVGMLLYILRQHRDLRRAEDEARHFRHLYETELQDNNYQYDGHIEDEEDDDGEEWKKQ